MGEYIARLLLVAFDDDYAGMREPWGDVVHEVNENAICSALRSPENGVISALINSAGAAR